MGRGIIKNVWALWYPSCAKEWGISKGPLLVKIINNDHGRVYCVFNNSEYADYECSFVAIKPKEKK